MACEVPVIGSSSGEIPHVIGDAGLVFLEGNASDLSDKLSRIMHDPDLRDALRHKGKERVLSRYTQKKIAEETYHVYQKMLS
jgi:glycosyltransferase involved in cell wall biosynthesis